MGNILTLAAIAALLVWAGVTLHRHQIAESHWDQVWWPQQRDPRR